MTKNIKKSVSILLAVIMVFSLFTIVPFTANAAGTYNKDSEGIADGVIMEPGYVIDTANTSKFLMFDSSINIDYYHNGDESWYENVGASWRGVESFYINNNNEYICYNVVNDIDHDSRLIPHEGMTFKVSYDAENDLWHIAEIEIPVPEPKLIAGHTLTLDGNIGINFYIDPSAAGLTPEEVSAEKPLTVSFEWADAESGPQIDVASFSKTITAKTSDNFNAASGYFKVTAEVCAAEMSADINVSVSLNGETKDEVYSVRKYCDTVLDKDSEFSVNYKNNNGKKSTMHLLTWSRKCSTTVQRHRQYSAFFRTILQSAV